MTGIAIYLEGGGHLTSSKAALRQGMNEFLGPIRDQARRRRLTWNVVPCGSREGARDAFVHAVRTEPEIFNVLLVDSEEPPQGTACEHLRAHDGWTLDSDPEALHLMVQSMETWIVADLDALRGYYRQGFLPNALPAHRDLETVSKADIMRALEHATRRTQKGAYLKIRHARDLLSTLDPALVMDRCRHCRRLFEILTARIEAVEP